MSQTDADLLRAADLRRAGDHASARDVLMAAASADPDDARVQYAAACVHDALGLEAAAVPFYERALAMGLADADAPSALIGLGSTLRVLGRYAEARAVLARGRVRFPQNRALDVFLAMTLHNLGEHAAAMGLLLHAVVDTSGDPGIIQYGRAIRLYADQPGRVWAGDGTEC